MKSNKKISPEEAVQFLENFRLMMARKDLESKLISIRVPENILNTYKTEAKLSGRKYQSLIVEAMRQFLDIDKKKP